jgi:hypothetical protein
MERRRLTYPYSFFVRAIAAHLVSRHALGRKSRSSANNASPSVRRTACMKNMPL